MRVREVMREVPGIIGRRLEFVRQVPGLMLGMLGLIRWVPGMREVPALFRWANTAHPETEARVSPTSGRAIFSKYVPEKRS